MTIIRNRKNEKSRAIASAIIGLLLLLGGFAILWGSKTVYDDYKASQNWPQLMTKIQDLDFVENDDKTFSLNISYSYTFNGNTYSDKYEDYYEFNEEAARQKYQKLKALLDQDSGWEVFVDPENPKTHLEEIVFPDFVAILILAASTFILFGLGILFSAIRLMSEIKKEKKLRAEYPHEPWKWNSKWKEGHICSERRNSIPIYIFALIFWFQLTSFFIYFGYSDPLEFNIALGIAGLMLFAGLIFTLLVVKSQIKLIKHGQSILRPVSFPGFSGSEFKAEVIVPFQLNPENEILFRIDCVKHYMTHDLRGEGHSRTNLYWKENFSAAKKDLVNEDDMTIIPFSIEIPPDLPESTEDGVTWSLEVSAKRETLNWNETFHLPVFHPKKDS